MNAPRPFPEWSEWQGLPLIVEPEVLAIVLDDGQAFRWHLLKDKSWLGFWDAFCLRLACDATGHMGWSAPKSLAAALEVAIPRYFSLDTPFDDRLDALPWRSDQHLASCIKRFPGLRLLRQPFSETLLCFLCSATKQIVQIKQMAEKMASSLGSPLAIDRPSGLNAFSFHRLPSWKQLDECSEAQLRACGLGFRAGYVKAVARFLAQNKGWLEDTEALPYPEAHARLVELRGVGAKIADCVLLYGGGKQEAFPVDTWIIKIMSDRYGLVGWKPEQIALFGRSHFGRSAGLAQQYLFNFERHPE
jgi:N-glycosylase/DNA lyase